ncbi:MAG: hypothetical protein HOP29_13445 [Phycisphaerales bacterium]|nr:hypothetical protein [Phycisphaerales bacterium]
MRRWHVRLAALWLVVPAALGADGPEGVGNDECVVFYGDKTVYPPGFGYVVENFIRVRYPASTSRFWHVGAPGDEFERVETLNAWFDELVVPLHPTVIVLSTGLGDGLFQKPDEARLATVASEYGRLIDRCLTSGARVYVVTPPPPSIARKQVLGSLHYDGTVKRIGDAIAGVAREKGVPVVDWYGAIVTLQAGGKATDLTGRDGLTPSEFSHSVAAKALMEAWRLEPLDVLVTVNWTGRTVTTSHGRAEVVEESSNIVRLKLSEFPIPLRIVGNPKGEAEVEPPAWMDRCRIVLKLEGVSDGQISIAAADSADTGLMFAASALGEGVNLAAGGPVSQHAAVVGLSDWIAKKNAAMQTIEFMLQKNRSEPPERELKGAIDAFVEAGRQYVAGCEKVILRLPRTMDIELRISVDTGGGR